MQFSSQKRLCNLQVEVNTTTFTEGVRYPCEGNHSPSDNGSVDWLINLLPLNHYLIKLVDERKLEPEIPACGFYYKVYFTLIYYILITHVFLWRLPLGNNDR